MKLNPAVDIGNEVQSLPSHPGNSYLLGADVRRQDKGTTSGGRA
jgi:hypothetical protein